MPLNQLLAYSITNPNSKWNATTPQEATSKTEDVISAVIGFLTLFAVLYFTIQIILAGYAYLSAQGDSDKVKKARNQITQSILGIAIIVVAIGLVSFVTNYIGLSSVFNLEDAFTRLGLWSPTLF